MCVYVHNAIMSLTNEAFRHVDKNHALHFMNLCIKLKLDTTYKYLSSYLQAYGRYIFKYIRIYIVPFTSIWHNNSRIDTLW